MIAESAVSVTQSDLSIPDVIAKLEPWSVGPVQIVILAPFDVDVFDFHVSAVGVGLSVEQVAPAIDGSTQSGSNSAGSVNCLARPVYRRVDPVFMT